MKLLDTFPTPDSVCSPVYVVGGYRFQVAADRELTRHEAIAYAAQVLREHPTGLNREAINSVTVVGDSVMRMG
jgi:hypothetical protein